MIRKISTDSKLRWLNLVGLSLELVGVVILFRFGMPFHVPTGGAEAIISSRHYPQVIALERVYEVLGYVGLALLVVGTLLQISAVVLLGVKRSPIERIKGERNPYKFRPAFISEASSYAARLRIQDEDEDQDRESNAKIGRWTRVVGIGTLLGVLVAGGAALIFRQQLSAMLEANRDSRQSFIDGNRAFVFVHSFDANAVTDPTTNQVIGWEINVVLENSGNTPTQKLVVKINNEFNAADPPQDEFPPDLEATKYDSIAVIRPRATSTTTDVRLTLDQIQDVLDGKSKFFIWGWAEYNDIFQNTPCHRTRFMDALLVVGNFRKVQQPGEANPLRFGVVGRFNDPDDHCTHARPIG